MTFPVLPASNPSGYNLNRSLRLRSSASAYLNRTFGTPTNGNVFTWSGWVKRGTLGVANPFFNPTDINGEGAAFNASNQLNISRDGVALLVSNQVFRDTSAWYHIVLVSDMGNATASLRFRVYVNGAEITSWATDARASYTSFPYWNKNGVAHQIGYNSAYPAYSDLYLAEVNFIDGQALTPSSFGAYNSTTGVWQPIKYVGTYGTNGFYLPFSDNSSTTNIALDYSGNGNNWTPNNISVTAGVTYDSMIDVPTNYADGGNGRGNYSTLNGASIGADCTLSGGNLNFAYGSSATRNSTMGTIGMPNGKWYWEMTVSASTNNVSPTIGISNQASSTAAPNYPGFDANGWGYSGDGNKYNSATGAAYGATYTVGDVVGVAFDADAGSLTFYKNGATQGVAYSGLAANTYYPAIGDGSSANTWSGSINFGQRPFAYTPPTGFKALNTQNLPTPTISNGANYMAATLYTGNGTTQSISNAVNGVSFQPDFVWVKGRNVAASSNLLDSVRGPRIHLESNLTDAEYTESAGVGLTAFNSNGFALGTDNAGPGQVNGNGNTYVAWQWKAGGTAVSNTAGSITSSVSANPTAGFSVVTYTGTGANATVGHGLGVAPSFIIIKSRSAVSDWMVGGSNIARAGNGTWSSVMEGLNTTSAINTGATASFNSTAPTNTVFSLGTEPNTNGSGRTQVAYCFAPVAGYSAFGSYTGSGSTDGPFVFTNFQPRWVMVKRTDSTSDWYIWDTSRDTYNVESATLLADTSGAETSATSIDGLSNGFKCRSATVVNASGGTYIYAAFASSPFKLSLAR